MAREGMTDLIETLRGMADAEVSEFTLGTVVYWNDNALQNVLDRHRQDFYEVSLSPIGSTTGGSIGFYRYETGIPNQESGTAVFKIADVGGTAYAGSAYNMDYALGILTWNSDTKGTVMYLSGRCYDLNAAAAEVWRFKAANATKYYDFSTDNHKLSRSQLRQAFLEQAQYYSGLAGPKNIEMVRGDLETYDLD